LRGFSKVAKVGKIDQKGKVNSFNFWRSFQNPLIDEASVLLLLTTSRVFLSHFQ
jgi:hypothetical protein